MTNENAKKIGSKQGLISAGLGLLIAQLIMTSFISIDKDFAEAFFWFNSIDYKLNIIIGGGIMLFCGHLYGEFAGKAILIKKKNFIIAGCLCGIAVLLTTAFLAGWTGFIQQGIHNTKSINKSFVDYIFKPFLWMTMFGAMPALIVGILLGVQIKAKGRKLEGIHSLHERK